jgi:hypothetical protein
MASDSRDRPALTKTVLEKAEDLIAKWDQDGGMTHRKLALRLRDIFRAEERR